MLRGGEIGFMGVGLQLGTYTHIYIYLFIFFPMNCFHITLVSFELEFVASHHSSQQLSSDKQVTGPLLVIYIYYL